MKNLANCTPREFLAQSNKIRKVVEKWLQATDIMNIRREKPEIPKDATKSERDALLQAQVKKNLSRILDAILEENPDETLELLALLCFVEPENVDDHPMSEYIRSVTELIENKDVLSFFTSLARLGAMSTSVA